MTSCNEFDNGLGCEVIFERGVQNEYISEKITSMTPSHAHFNPVDSVRK